jgi:TPR repeat protein
VAQNNLGAMYEKGEGVTQNSFEAVKWYRKAAEQNDAAAQNNLGRVNYFGLGVPKDNIEAMQWWLKAANQGLPEAQSSVGDMYHNAYGVVKDDIQSYMWIKLAAQQGDQRALSDLQKLDRSMTTDQIAEAKLRASEWAPIKATPASTSDHAAGSGALDTGAVSDTSSR